MFILEAQERGNDWAEEFLNHFIERRLEKAITPLSDPDAIQQVPMTAIAQPKEDDCGPTNALMILYTAGRASYVQGSTNNQKIANLYASTGYVAGAGAPAGKVRDTINSYMASGYKNYTSSSASTKTMFVDKVHESLRQGYAAILHISNSKLPYWDGYGDGHYVSAYYINTNTTNNTIKIADSYNGLLCTGSPYLNTFGNHTVSIDTAHNALKSGIIYYD